MLVNGQGGIGKTSFASKYWRKYEHKYSHLAFLFVGDKLTDDESPITNTLLRLAPKLGLQFTNETTAQQLQILIETATNLPKPCLLILDNVNQEDDLKENITFLCQCDNFHILMTSRLADFDYSQKHNLGALEKPDALELFKTHYKAMDDEEITLFDEIYEATGGNTLVLELLAKNLRHFNNKLRKRYTFQNLLDDLQNGLTKLSQQQKVDTVYHAKGTGLRNETPEAIILAMYDLTELNDYEKKLLSIFAVLPAENIAFETLEKFENMPDLDQKLLDLAKKGWIDFYKENLSFKVSPVVQEVTRRKNENRLVGDCRIVIKSLISTLDFISNDNYHKENYKNILLDTHYAESIIHILKYYLVNSFNGIDILSLISLYEVIGKSYELIGQISKALFFFTENDKCIKQNLTKIFSTNTTEYNFLLLTNYQNLGNTYQTLGYLDISLNLYKKSKRISKKLCKKEPDTIEFLHSLSVAYQNLGKIYQKLKKAEISLHFLKLRHKISQEISVISPDTLRYQIDLVWSNQYLGVTHFLGGNYLTALQYYEEMYEIAKKIYNQDTTNPDTKNALSLSCQSLGECYHRLNDLEHAQKFYIEFNSLQKELQSHSKNMMFYNNLGLSYQFLGDIGLELKDWDTALNSFLEMNRIFKELYQVDAQNVQVKHHLAISYIKLGKFYELCLNTYKARDSYITAKEHYHELLIKYNNNPDFQTNLEAVIDFLKGLENSKPIKFSEIV